MSDLREVIGEAIATSLVQDNKLAGISDAVLAAITAHLTVTDSDMFAGLRVWREAVWQDNRGKRDGVRSVLEAFVASKLKGEPK